MKKTLLAALISAALLGCHTPEVQYDSTKRQSTTDVELFRDGRKPAKAYKEIAMISDKAQLVDQPNIESDFIKKAKRMGGNALILYPPEKDGGKLGWFAIVDMYIFKASVLVYSEPR